jgi:hypothetical protein
MIIWRINRLLFSGVLLLVCGFSLLAQPLSFDSQKELEYIINYLEFSQQKESDPPYHFKGEWPCYIENLKTIPLLGKKGKRAYDSNCMLSSLIFNILAEYSIKNPDNEQVKKILRDAIGNFEYYKIGDVFHFWHELERAEHLQKKKHKANPEKYYQRRANNFFYRSRLINGMMNLCPDLDDASSVWLSHHLYNTVFGTDSMPIPDSPGKYLDNYADLNRRNESFYNETNRHGSETGAFLTWFRDEKETGLRYFYPGKGYYVPFGTNDKDAVVNANIIYSLSILKDTTYPSYRNSAKFINFCFRKNKFTTASNYYPTRYTLHYATSKAFYKGCTRLKESTDIIYAQLPEQQMEDGSYPCDIKNNELQATIYALNAMIYLRLSGYKGLEENIIRAFEYVMCKRIQDDKLCSWPEGVCGSVGSFVRKSHVWKSSAYTTALMLEAISNYFSL